MSRKLRPEKWDSRKVDECQIAPHRYTWDGKHGEYENAKTVTEFIRGVPYKAGDVVFVAYGDVAKRALITHVGAYRDRFGDRKEWFQVLLETKRGEWARVWNRTYPGPIQRGYKLAGRAPDIPD